MKTVRFSLDTSPGSFAIKHVSGNDYEYTFTVRLLPAFAVEYFALYHEPLVNLQGPNDRINGDNLVLVIDQEPSHIENDPMSIILHYHGIRDYALLFPWVTDSALQKRLGAFYHEAEVAFENASWLSYSLMCGAVFEGMLYEKAGRPQRKIFKLLIDDALTSNKIDNPTAGIMHKIRNQRNLVHAGKFRDPFVSRADAMDVQSALNRLIWHFC